MVTIIMDLNDKKCEAMQVVLLDDNKKYVIIEKLNHDNHTYVYLAELGNATNYIIGELENDIITDVEDQRLLKELILKFSAKLGNTIETIDE